jgi:hypothetical protein
MKMVKIYDDLNNIENKSFKNNLNPKINIVDHINSISNIFTFAKEKISENNKNFKRESYNVKTDYTSFSKRKNSGNTNIISTYQNKNTEILEVYSNSISNENSLIIQKKQKMTDSEFIFQILFLLVIEEIKIAKYLKSKIKTNNIYEYYLINNSWMEEFKEVYNYKEIYKLYTNIENNKDNINLKISKAQTKNLIKKNSKISESIKINLNNSQIFSELNDVKKLSHWI